MERLNRFFSDDGVRIKFYSGDPGVLKLSTACVCKQCGVFCLVFNAFAGGPRVVQRMTLRSTHTV